MKKLSIISLNWNKIYLTVIFNQKIEDDLYLLSHNQKKRLICKDYIFENELRMPITCAYTDSMIEDGAWNFSYQEELVTVSIEEAKQLEQKDKVFFYKKNSYAYIVNFNIDEEFHLVMNISYMKKNLKPLDNRLLTNTKHSFLRHFINLAFWMVRLALKTEYFIVSTLTRKRENKILFMSETRDSLEGNLLSLNNRICERGLNHEYKLYYSFKKVLKDKKSIWYYLKTTALIAKMDYIFIDDYAPIFNFLNLRKTKLIQLWHAGVGFKSVGYSRFGKDGSPHPFISPHRKYDYAVVAAPNLIPIYQEVFGLTKEHFLALGMLRLDGYMEKDRITSISNQIYRKYPIIKGKEVILFAPTYRGSGQATAYYDIEQLDLTKLYNLCKSTNYVVLFKFHPFIKNKIKIDEKYEDFMIDISDYPDINELFYITDVLITDYSSNIYEYSLFEKPIIFFDYDMDKYAILRGVHEDLNHSPGNICKTFDEVLTVLKKKNFNIEKVKEFKQKNIGVQDSKACDRLIEILFKK